METCSFCLGKVNKRNGPPNQVVNITLGDLAREYSPQPRPSIIHMAAVLLFGKQMGRERGTVSQQAWWPRGGATV